jgi:uncharacterized protein YutE (UPF0331/DUF86 family)/predicted nucleotidyltransferase
MNPLIKELKQNFPKVLSKFEQVEFAYLFGSFLRGGDFEDIDVAVCISTLPPSPLARFKLAMEIGRALERELRPRFEVDVKLLNEAPPWFQAEVLRTGKLIFARMQGLRVAYEAVFLSRHLDYQPMRDRILANYLKGDNMLSRQPQLMEPLQELEEALGDWERYQTNISLEDLRTDRDRRNMVLHALLVAIQACIDIAHRLIAQRHLRQPATYREAFEILAEAGIIPLELADCMADLAGFRNVLVHIYWRLDIQRVYEVLQQERQRIAAFCDIVRRTL